MADTLWWVPTILNSIADAVIVGDVDGCVTFMNPAAEALTGNTLEQAMGACVSDVFPLFDEETGDAIQLPRPMASLECRPIELPKRLLLLRTKRGTLVPIEQTTSPIEEHGIILGTVVVFRDVSVRRRHEELLRRRNERLQILSEATGKLLSNDHPEAMVTRLFEIVSRHLELDAYFNFMVNAEADGLELDSCAGITETEAQSIKRLGFGEAVCGTVGLLRKPFVAAEIQNSDDEKVQTVKGFGFRAYTCNPLMAGDRLIGTLSFATRTRDRFSDDELEFLEAVCHYVALAKERQRLLNEERERADRLERSAEALSQSEYELRFALEVGRLGSWYLEFPSQDMRCSAQCRADFGRAADEPFTYNDFLNALHPDDREYVFRRIEKAFATGEDYEAEYRAYWPDGSLHWIFARGRPLDRVSESTLGFVGLTLDITDRKRNEALLEQQKHILELVVLDSSLPEVLDALCRMIETQFEAEEMHASILLIDPDGVHLRHGAAPTLPEAYCRAIDGIAIGPAVGSCGTAAFFKKPVYACDIANDPLWADYAALALSHGLQACWSYPILSSSGVVLGSVALYYHRPRQPGPNDLRLIDIVTRTATIAIERKRFEDELHQRNAQLIDADRRKNVFLAMLAHELRNPLSSISNAAQLLREDPTGEHRGWANDVLDRQVKHLARLIDDLLDVSRLTHGKIELQRERIDVADVLNQAVEAVRPTIELRGQRLTVSSPRGALLVHADPLRLEQVFTNLLTNAVKYTPEGGRISVSAVSVDENVILSVEDNGVGISPERIPQMFELFTQGDRTLARSEGGLGIGLTIVKTLVEMHGGTVTAASDGPGQGSTFRVTLPTVSQECRPTGIPEATLPLVEAMPKAKPDRNGRGRRLLVVDDNADTVRSMARLLRLKGHEVATASTGFEAVERVNEFKPEIVLLDIGLPGMDGYQVAQKLRAENGHEGLLIIAISGYGQDDDRRRSTSSGFDHHLVKPIDHDALLTLIGGPC
ncbi:PAS domain S-box-containing protein [Singulisphaera sp. GP187]|uniref:GAF domain-containing protein n=1 Tax=Singulisphaera sp. GP187 TaxID=1882752 RepID=UPI0009283CA9|nr:GAF domain-containing protein [Singulisphaera sp. GP187]SIO29544.1 PAS domain S-box-containing protein [Singulisphaera sp. GP187]